MVVLYKDVISSSHYAAYNAMICAQEMGKAVERGDRVLIQGPV